jgi:hypothetical protein
MTYPSKGARLSDEQVDAGPPDESHSRTRSKARFQLPIGYAPLDDADEWRCVGQMARVFARYAELVRKHELRSQPLAKGKDGPFEAGGGLRTARGDGIEPSLARFMAVLKVIRKLADPRLLSLVRGPGLTSRFDERYIARNIDRAHFLANGTPIFDLMWTERPSARNTVTDVACIAAWIGLDAIHHFLPAGAADEIGPSLLAEWRSLAERCEQNLHMGVNSSLFGSHAAQTRATLLDALERSRRVCPPLYEDHRHLEQLLEEYLDCSLQTEGDIWGIWGWKAWESACLERARSLYGDAQICTCDGDIPVDVDGKTRESWKEFREEAFAANGVVRCPDLVIRLGPRVGACGREGGSRPEEQEYLIIDFKYAEFKRPRNVNEETFFTKRPKMPDLRELQVLKRCTDYLADALSGQTVDAEALAARLTSMSTLLSTLPDQLKAFQDITNVEAYRWLLMQHVGARSTDKIRIELWAPGTVDEMIEPKWKASRPDGTVLDHASFEGFKVHILPSQDVFQEYAERFKLL